MKSLMLPAALCAFLIATAAGFMAGNSLDSIFWKSSAAAAIGGLLGRWWGRAWIRNLECALRARAAAAATSPLTTLKPNPNKRP
jgi:hypothetical protein